MVERDPGYQPIAGNSELIAKTLAHRMDEPDPSDYCDLDRDYSYYCLCQYCEQCDELNYFFRFMREFEEKTDYPYEDP